MVPCKFLASTTMPEQRPCTQPLPYGMVWQYSAREQAHAFRGPAFQRLARPEPMHQASTHGPELDNWL